MAFWIIGAVAVLAILTYVGFIIFLPEWVGITGKKALDNERSQREGETAVDPDFFAMMNPGTRKPKDPPGN